MQVKLTLVEGADATQFVRDLSNTRGVQAIAQVFPGESDQRLSSLYVADLDRARLAATLRHLRRDARVENVEAPAPRKLIRPRPT